MEKKKFNEITLMNAFLCLCVVMIHLTSTPVTALRQGSLWQIVIFIINKGLCFSVPSFIFLSGFKLYNKYKDAKIDLKRFYGGRFKKIVIPYLISVVVYFAYFYHKKWVSTGELPQYIFLGTLVAHFYYIVIAVQSYIIFPVLNRLFKRFPKAVVVFSLICTVCCHELMNWHYTDRFIGTYIFYFVLGMLCSEYKLYEKISKIALISGAGFVIVGIIHLKFSYSAMTGAVVYRYAELVNLAYVVFSIGVIYGVCVILGQMDGIFTRCMRGISNRSYYIYLYHIMILFVLQYDVFPRFNISVGEQFIISCLVMFTLIFAYCLLDNRIKHRQRVGY